MNVMITCAGRRNLLVRYFRDSIGISGRVHAADANPLAPALQEAHEVHIVPPIDAPGYVDSLVAICRDAQIGLLLSVNDLELPLLAAARQRFLNVGTRPVVSSPEVVQICFDKWETAAFVRRIGLPSPRTYLTLAEARRALAEGIEQYPLVVKPRWGTASIGVEYPANDAELGLLYQIAQQRVEHSALVRPSRHDLHRAVLIQQQVRGQEYGLDVVNDLEGRHAATFVKKKLSDSQRSDGVGHAVTVDNAALAALGRTIAEQLGHVGNLDCDVFISGDEPYVLDLNPRFGGGYPFSHLAGANVPAALLAWARGHQPEAAWLRVEPGVTAARYDALTRIAPARVLA